MIEIRKITPADYDEVWEIIRAVISTGDTYLFHPTSSKDKMLSYWCGADKYTYIALIDNKIAGTFCIKDNQPDLGSHVANASFMASPNFAGQGVGKTMGLYALEEAKNLGYKAMQFNMVVKSNERAVELWKKLGFQIIAEIPDAFNHQQLGLTNAYIMFRKL